MNPNSSTSDLSTHIVTKQASNQPHHKKNKSMKFKHQPKQMAVSEFEDANYTT